MDSALTKRPNKQPSEPKQDKNRQASAPGLELRADNQYAQPELCGENRGSLLERHKSEQCHRLERIRAQLPDPCYLLVAGSPQPVAPELLKTCAAFTQMTVAIDSGASSLQAVALPIDLLIGDMDSTAPELLAALRAKGVTVLAVDAHKDQTDLELALAHSAKAGARSVVIAGALGGRVDHQLAVFGACAAAAGAAGAGVAAAAEALATAEATTAGTAQAAAAEALAIVIISDDELIWIIGSGQSVKLGDYLASGQTFSVLALTAGVMLSEQGTEWELTEAPLSVLDPRGVSNRVCKASAQVTILSGIAAVIVPRMGV